MGGEVFYITKHRKGIDVVKLFIIYTDNKIRIIRSILTTHGRDAVCTAI